MIKTNANKSLLCNHSNANNLTLRLILKKEDE